jgi:GGDEF domain-containing protein
MLRAGDTVGRLGGDEFVILTEGASLADGPLLVAERIREALHEPFHLEGYEGLPINGDRQRRHRHG